MDKHIRERKELLAGAKSKNALQEELSEAIKVGQYWIEYFEKLEKLEMENDKKNNITSIL